MIIEFRKLFKNRITYISFFSLLLIVIGNVWSGIRNYREDVALAYRLYPDYPDSLALISPYQYWAGMSNTFFSSFYYFIFPLLIALPIVDTIYRERTTGNLHYQIIRMSRFSYYLKKILFSYGVSFLFFIAPLIIDMLLINLITGQWDYSAYSQAYKKLLNGTAIVGDGTFRSQLKTLFSGLMEISPYLYVLVYYIIGGLYAGAYTCFGLAASLFIKNRYLILFIPICLYLGCWIMFSLTGFLAWDPFNFLAPTQPVSRMSYLPFIVDFAVLMIATVILYFVGARKQVDIHE